MSLVYKSVLTMVHLHIYLSSLWHCNILIDLFLQTVGNAASYCTFLDPVYESYG